MTAKVRRATATDASALAEIASKTFPLACPPHTTQAAIDDFLGRHLSERNFDEYLADPARELLLAEVGAESAGYAMIVHGVPADPDVATSVAGDPTSELSKFYVLEQFHGAGVASAIMTASLLVGRAHGSASVWLGVNKLNARANRFYTKHGFAIVGSKKFLVGNNWEDDFVRERMLC